MIEEVWKPIITKQADFTGLYEISNYGRIKSFPRRGASKTIKILKPGTSRNYYVVKLCKNKEMYDYLVHHLVWDTFREEKRNGRILQVDHIDNDPHNNCIDNLQLLTNRENLSKGWQHKRKNKLPTGVSRSGRCNTYLVRVKLNGKRIKIGRFITVEEASRAYQNFIKLNGE